jgi:hypothetical protein
MSDQHHCSRSSKILILLAVLLAGGGIIYSQNKQAAGTPDNAPPQGASPDVAATDAKAPVEASAFKDGSYSTTGQYGSPAGDESIDVTLTVAGGKIVDTSMVANATNPASKIWQEKFASGYREFVVGKDLAGLSLGVVSGSSLTPKGFNDALEDIRSQAGA